MIRIANALFALFDYGAFIWGVWAIFRRTDDKNVGLSTIKVGALVAAISEIMTIALTPNIPLVRGTLGLFLYALSILLFFWTASMHRHRKVTLAFSSDIPEHFVSGGPYRFVRHPFYVAYVNSYVAGLVATGNFWLLIVVIGMAVLYFRAARFEEEKFAVSSFAKEYEAYRATTGMFLPRLIVNFRFANQ